MGHLWLAVSSQPKKAQVAGHETQFFSRLVFLLSIQKLMPLFSGREKAES
jgi:hypothetical protein